MATLWAYLLNRFMNTLPLLGPGTDLGVFILCAVLLAGSRDALTKFRFKMGRLLGPVAEKVSTGDVMTNGMDHHAGNAAPSKPQSDGKPEAQAAAAAKPADPKTKGGEKSK